MNERITAPPACASPDGAPSLRAPTPAAGVQTGRVVVSALSTDWPLSGLIPTVVHVTFGDGTVADYMAYLDTGVAVGSSGTATLPYFGAPLPVHTTDEQDEAAEVALTAAWDAHGREAA